MLAWLAGLAIQLQQESLVSRPWAFAVGGLAVALLMLAIACRAKVRRWHVAAWCGIWVACALLSWSITTWRAHTLLQASLPEAWQDEDLVLEGRVEGLPTQRGGTLAIDVLVDRLSRPGQTAEPADLPQRVSLYWQAGENLGLVQAGQVWRWTVRLQRPVGVGNPGGFDAALWLLDKGVRATGSVRVRKGVPPPVLLAEPLHGWSAGMIDRARQAVREAIGRRVSDARAAGVLAGLTIGDQAAIDREDWDVFRKTGVAHAVSISGMHIAMVGWLGSLLLASLWRRSAWLMHHCAVPTVQLAGGVLVALSYALLAGWGVPAQRTVCMMAVWAVLRMLGRPWPWPLVWLVSAVVVTVMDPWALYQAGFWLSFVAVGVLMSSGTTDGAARPAAAGWPQRAGHMAGEMVRTQWLTTVSLTPLAAVCFQQVSIVGFLANLLAIPVFTAVITPLALAGVVCPLLWSLAAWVTSQFSTVLASMAGWPWAATRVALLPGWLTLLIAPAAACLILPVPRHWRWIGLPAVLCLVWLPGRWTLLPPPAAGQFSVVAADVGQGSSVLVRTAQHTMVFDAGPKVGDRGDAGQRVVLPLLGTLGITRLDRLVISHRDTDHVGGAAAIVAEVPVDLLHSSLEDEHPLRRDPVRGRTLPHSRCEAGQRWQWDGVDFTVLHPTAADYEQRAALSPNALSCVIQIRSQALPAGNAASVLLAGDIEAEQEAAILDRARRSQAGLGALKTQLLIVPHHGSKTSSTPPFLAAVQPRQAVIQVGRRNGYGHPSPEVLARYDEMGMARVATPACGAFVWNSGDVASPEAITLRLDARQRLRTGRCWRQAVRHYWD